MTFADVVAWHAGGQRVAPKAQSVVALQLTLNELNRAIELLRSPMATPQDVGAFLANHLEAPYGRT